MGAINQRVSEIHTDSAMISLKNGDWDSARRHWARAVNNAELENESDATRSMLHYEYGRALGVTCFFDLAQQELLESLELDRISSGPFHMPLLELARLNLDQKKWVESQRYYEELFLVYDAVGAEDLDPASVALVYEEYAPHTPEYWWAGECGRVVAQGGGIAGKSSW